MRVLSDRDETLVRFTGARSQPFRSVVAYIYLTLLYLSFSGFTSSIPQSPTISPQFKPPFNVCHLKHYFLFQPLCLSPLCNNTNKLHSDLTFGPHIDTPGCSVTHLRVYKDRPHISVYAGGIALAFIPTTGQRFSFEWQCLSG